MLSRTADNLYWIARYIERAETMAGETVLRLVDAMERQPDIGLIQTTPTVT